MKLYPGLNRLLIKELEVPEDKSSLIVSSVKPFNYGEIYAIGAIKEKEAIGDDMFKVGDKVYFLPQSGITVEVEEGSFKLINITEVLVGRRA